MKIIKKSLKNHLKSTFRIPKASNELLKIRRQILQRLISEKFVWAENFLRSFSENLQIFRPEKKNVE